MSLAQIKICLASQGIKLISFLIFDTDKTEETVLTTNNALIPQLVKKRHSKEYALMLSTSTLNIVSQANGLVT